MNTMGPKTFAKYSRRSLFILGSGRNASTLMALLLNRHPEVFLPPEQFALPYSVIRWKLGGFLRKVKFASSTLEMYKKKNQNWKLPADRYDEIRQVISSDTKRHSNPVFIFEEVMAKYASFAKNSNPRWLGDHSPLTTVFGRMVLPLFVESKFIFMVRHPLDVIQSYQNIPVNPASKLEYAAWKWNNSIREYERLIKRQNTSVLLVRYEDFVAAPSETMTQVFNFLEIEALDVVSLVTDEKSSDPMGANDKSNHQKLYGPITSDAVNSWRTKMSDNVYERSVPLVSKYAKRFNYDLSR
ncbi:sulfotransferase family protein [Phaeocystidibacter luteus]|nr:sulfotransferase [Phaeocystidibacter luteus]